MADDTASRIHDYHVHLYFNADEVERARALAGTIQQRFGTAVGHFHTRAVGPHPRGSVQLTVAPERFGALAAWLPVNRDGLTVFAHPSTGDDKADHTRHVIWFGPSEPLATEMFG